jgi:uncharacterized protein
MSALRALASRPVSVPRIHATVSIRTTLSILYNSHPSPTHLNTRTPIYHTSPNLPTRTFTTTPAIMSTFKYEYLVSIPDVPGTLEKRMSVRPQHLAALKPLVESGQVVFGGATMAKQPADGEAPELTGSAMLIKANSEQEVRDLIEKDEYAKAGTWDVPKMQITAFRCAVRTAM